MVFLTLLSIAVLFAVLFFIISLILFGLVAIVGSISGGATLLYYVKHEMARKLILSGALCLFLLGVLVLNPLIVAYFNISEHIFTFITIGSTLTMIIVSGWCIRNAKVIENQVAKIATIIVFWIFLVIAAVILLLFILAILKVYSII